MASHSSHAMAGWLGVSPRCVSQTPNNDAAHQSTGQTQVLIVRKYLNVCHFRHAQVLHS